MSRAVQLSSDSVEHYGPDYLGAMVRQVFGGPIDLDPASCAQANMLIQAERYYTQEDDGLTKPWVGTVYLNPPGGRVRPPGGGSLVNSAALWYATLVRRFEYGLVSQAIFMVFNLELVRYAQRYMVTQPLDYPYCLPQGRIDFWKPGKGSPVPQGQPGHPNAIVYMGPNVDAFRAVFEPASGSWSGGLVRSDHARG